MSETARKSQPIFNNLIVCNLANHIIVMLLSIKSIAALSLVPLSFAQDYFDKAEQGNICNFVGNVNRLNFVNNPVANSLLSDSVQSSLTPFSSYCPTLDGQVGTPVCQTSFVVSPFPPSSLLVQTSHCPNVSPANQLVDIPNLYGCFTYYQFPSSAATTFICPITYTPLCRYCALQDFTPELSRNLLYVRGSSLASLTTFVAVPFLCKAPKCPAFAVVPNTNPTKYARLSAAYCSSAVNETGSVMTPYAGLVNNFACGAGLNQAIINQKWGCYIANNPPNSLSSPGTWCEDPNLIPFCYYDVSKPYSYPLIAAP